MNKQEDAKQRLARCRAEEARYRFAGFSQDEAWRLGQLLRAAAARFEKPVALEIRLNQLTVFRYFPEGTGRYNELWLKAKSNCVDLLGISSLQLYFDLLVSGETLADRRMREEDYAAYGGAFPLRLRDGALIGSIAASGLPHEQDHQVILDALEQYFA